MFGIRIDWRLILYHCLHILILILSPKKNFHLTINPKKKNFNMATYILQIKMFNDNIYFVIVK